jgi:hypothetical protein
MLRVPWIIVGFVALLAPCCTIHWIVAARHH